MMAKRSVETEPKRATGETGKTARARKTVEPVAKDKRATGKPSSPAVVERIASVGGWQGRTLAEVRRLIFEADPDITEECKWAKPTNPAGVPVWSRAGIVCTGEAYKQVVKLTFLRGASLDDPQRLFNAGLEGNTRRAIDIREGEVLDAAAFKALIWAAVAENLGTGASKST